MISTLRLALVTGASALLAGQACAADAVGGEFNELRFELGAGVEIAPAYEGSDRYEAAPTFSGGFERLRFGSIDIGGGPDTGLIFGPSFRFVNEREASEDRILTGIPDVDVAVELGVKLGYEWENARVFGQVRYGVSGHDGFIGELGADAIFRPYIADGQETKFSIGPRLSIADDDFHETYFSVPNSAAFLTPFDADSGIKSVGVAATVRHDFNAYWAVEAQAEYARLVGDAEDSPITQAGDEDQFIGKLSLIRKFHFVF